MCKKLFEIDEIEERGLEVPLFKYILTAKLAEQSGEKDIARNLRVRESWLREFRRDDPARPIQKGEGLTTVF